MTLREKVLQFPKTLYALVIFLVGNAITDVKEQISNANKFWKAGDFQKIADFFKSQNIHVGLITTPSGIFMPWVTGNNFINMSLQKFNNAKDAWLAGFEIAASIIEGELPEIPKFKTLTKQDVIDGINTMPNQFTTLDLKNYLRGQGFYAEQKQVSDFMTGIASELDIDYTDNGTYRTYTKPEVTQDAPTQDDTTTTTPDPATQDAGKTPGFFRPTVSKAKKFDSGKVGNWECSMTGGRKSKVYKNTSWLQAKKQYAREHSVKYFDVRIRKA